MKRAYDFAMGNRVAAGALALALGACGDNIVNPEVAGVVFEDLDGDGSVDTGERPLAGVTVYVDLDDDSVRDLFDPAAVTGADGAYRIDMQITGEVAVRQEVPFGMANVSGGVAPAVPPTRPHIIGGGDAGDSEYPFMAAVGVELNGSFIQFCGAALIAPRFVVTAAHCTEGFEVADARVVLGSTDLDAGQTRQIRAMTMHPEYNGDVTLGNDIAVWELAEPIDFLFFPDLFTVELAGPPTSDLMLPGALATTIGWGASDTGSALLQEVHVPIASDEECSAGYPEVESFATQLCAGASEGGIDSCSGDSGGPLMVRDPERDVWIHAGVTSWGDGCALPGRPGVYARTAALSDWVRDTAREPSRVHRVTAGGAVVRADFGNQPNLRPQAAAIDPRVQLTALTLANAPGGDIAAGAQVDLDFRVLSDGAPAGLSCQLDADGPGPIEPAAVSCDAGANRISYPGYPDGAFRADLRLDHAGQTFVRSAFLIAGTPSSDIADGALAAGDQTDPDFSMSTYFIDHYELTGTAENVLTIVEITTDFGAYIALYDADQRDASGGGTLDVITVESGRGTMRFYVGPGRRYLVGISSLAESATGSYTVELINNGTLTPVTL